MMPLIDALVAGAEKLFKMLNQYLLRDLMDDDVALAWLSSASCNVFSAIERQLNLWVSAGKAVCRCRKANFYLSTSNTSWKPETSPMHPTF